MAASPSFTQNALVPRMIGIFLPWYFLERPKAIVRAYIAYAHAFLEVFAFTFLLKTLLSPWKSIRDPYQKRGFNLERFLETLTLNVVSRVIGMIVRIFAMLCGIIFQLGAIVFFISYLTIWLLFPIALSLGIVYLLLSFS